MPADKAPGPDGFTKEFYVLAWAIIKSDVIRAMHAFHNADRRGFQGLNNALITLLPKKNDAKTTSDYRPICLNHSFAKLAAKTMARRLAPMLDQLVDVNHSAFIQKRSIHDNFWLVQGVVKLIQQRKLSRLQLKLGIAKAFDTVSWPFLLQILEHIGFGSKWQNWMSLLLSTATVRVILNGEPGKPVHMARGLRQGDPLSPMIFVIVMDVLHRLLAQASRQGILQPSGNPAILHQCSLYADDAVLFITPTEQDLQATRAILDLFGEASGLRTNITKCQIVPICCSEDDKQRTSAILPGQIMEFPVTYLGIPLSTGRLRKKDIERLIQKVQGHLPTWKAGFLQKPGHLSLVKTTLSAIPIHTIIAVKLPAWAIDAITKCFWGFFLGRRRYGKRRPMLNGMAPSRKADRIRWASNR